MSSLDPKKAKKITKTDEKKIFKMPSKELDNLVSENEKFNYTVMELAVKFDDVCKDKLIPEISYDPVEEKKYFCTNCNNKETALDRCGGCKNARYCNRKCQKEDWKNHKEKCGSKENLNKENSEAKETITFIDKETNTPIITADLTVLFYIDDVPDESLKDYNLIKALGINERNFRQAEPDVKSAKITMPRIINDYKGDCMKFDRYLNNVREKIPFKFLQALDQNIFYADDNYIAALRAIIVKEMGFSFTEILTVGINKRKCVVAYKNIKFLTEKTNDEKENTKK